MKPIWISGWGAVSPAGWGTAVLREALHKGCPLPAKPIARPGWNKPLMVCEVPLPSPRPAFFSHPRLRRVSPITLYAAAAALEALEKAGVTGTNRPPKLGLILCLLTGCVQYSHRFFKETLEDPATASPLVFPETVFNAPASHVAALLGQGPLTYTLLGDPATYLQGIALAADWLLEGRVEGCLVVGAEETNWVLADVLWHFDHQSRLAGGAGAVYLCCSTSSGARIALNQITDAYGFSSGQSRQQAAQRMRRSLPGYAPDEFLCDSRLNRPRYDKAEQLAWQDWPGTRVSPKAILGDGLMASGAWQCVTACDALAQGKYRAANVSIVGTNQKTIGARFTHSFFGCFSAEITPSSTTINDCEIDT